MKKSIVLLVLFMIIGLFAAGCGGGQQADKSGNDKIEKQVWKIAHEEIPGSVQDAYAQKFKQLIEKRTNGAVQVEVYPVGEIGDAIQHIEFAQSGVLEFILTNPGNIGTTIPETQLFYLHFLLPDDEEQVREILNTSKAIEMLNDLHLDHGLKVLDWFPEGYMMWTANKPLRTPEDFRGFKMRTMQSPLIVATYEAYGANPTPMPYLEVYSGLQLGLIDGQVNPLFAIEEMKFYEVQDYIMLSKQDTFVAYLAAGLNFYEGLSDELKSIVKEVVDECNEYVFEVQKRLNSERLEAMKAARPSLNVIELTEEEREVFRQASMPARERFVSIAGPRGKEILDLLVQEVEALR